METQVSSIDPRHPEFRFGSGGSLRFKVENRTVLEVTEDWISFKGEVLSDAAHVAKAFVEFIEQMKMHSTASEVLFVLEGHKERLSTMERRVRDLEVKIAAKELEIMAQEQVIKSLKNSDHGITVSGTGASTSWHAQAYSEIR